MLIAKRHRGRDLELFNFKFYGSQFMCQCQLANDFARWQWPAVCLANRLGALKSVARVSDRYLPLVVCSSILLTSFYSVENIMFMDSSMS